MSPSNNLKWFQTVPVKHALTLGNSANFSVPGSGKTWMAYSTYFSLKKRGDVNKLLVVCPLAAFKPWETEYEIITGKEKIHKRIIGSPEKRLRIYEDQDDNEIDSDSETYSGLKDSLFKAAEYLIKGKNEVQDYILKKDLRQRIGGTTLWTSKKKMLH